MYSNCTRRSPRKLSRKYRFLRFERLNRFFRLVRLYRSCLEELASLEGVSVDSACHDALLVQAVVARINGGPWSGRVVATTVARQITERQ